MPELLVEHGHEIWVFITGAVTGGACGSFLTFRLSRSYRASGGKITDQSRARAGGDIVGGSKTVTSGRGNPQQRP